LFVFSNETLNREYKNQKSLLIFEKASTQDDSVLELFHKDLV